MKKKSLNKVIDRTLVEMLKDSFNNDDFKECFYCGSLAEEKDHIVPISFFGDRDSRDYNLPTVDSCRICNALANNLLPYGCYDKKEQIKELFWDRYGKIMEQDSWTDNEISSLSGNLKRTIRSYEVAKTILRQKYDNLCTNKFYGVDSNNITQLDGKIAFLLTKMF